MLFSPLLLSPWTLGCPHLYVHLAVLTSVCFPGCTLCKEKLRSFTM